MNIDDMPDKIIAEIRHEPRGRSWPVVLKKTWIEGDHVWVNGDSDDSSREYNTYEIAAWAPMPELKDVEDERSKP